MRKIFEIVLNENLSIEGFIHLSIVMATSVNTDAETDTFAMKLFTVQ